MIQQCLLYNFNQVFINLENFGQNKYKRNRKNQKKIIGTNCFLGALPITEHLVEIIQYTKKSIYKLVWV